MAALQGFFKDVGKNNLLTREEEVELSQKMEAGDTRARQKMINSNLRLAISIAKKYQNRGCDLEDLIQESSIGLIKAVDRFDWRKGFKFSTYACWWIKQAVRRHVASHGSSVRLPSYAKNVMWKIKNATEEYEKEFGVKPTQDELADILCVSRATLDSIIECSGSPISMDSPAGYRSGEGGRLIGEMIEDTTAISPDEVLDRQCIKQTIVKALGTLTEREEKILRLRFGIADDPTDHSKHPITFSQQQDMKGELS